MIRFVSFFMPVNLFAEEKSSFVTDKNHSFRSIGSPFADHDLVNDSHTEFFLAIYVTIPQEPLAQNCIRIP